MLQMSRNYYRKPMVMALKNAILHLFPMIARRRRWQTPVLETARLVLRQINPTDFEDVRAWFPGAPDAAANAQTHLDYFAREYREHVIGPWGMQFKKTGVLVGNCGFPDLSLRKRRGGGQLFRRTSVARARTRSRSLDRALTIRILGLWSSSNSSPMRAE